MRARFVFLSIALVFVFAAAAGAQDDEDAPRLVTVTGVSEIWVEPDEAVLSFGVSSRAQTLEQAQRIQELETQKALGAIKGAKIGRPYRIEEHETGDVIPLQANLMLRAEAAGQESTIAAGQIRVSARVTVSFELQ